MSARIKYSEHDIGEPRVVADFLPSPEELAFQEESVKVTIALSQSSVDFFKDKAKDYGTQYQKMIRRLLDAYVKSQQGGGPKAGGKRPTR